MTRSQNPPSPTCYKPLLLHVFHGFGSGGAQTRFVRLANHFAKSLCHVVVSMNGDYSCIDKVSAEADVRLFRIKPERWLMPRLLEYNAVLRAVRPDCVVTHNWGTIEWAIAARLRGIRHIHIEDGFGPEEARDQKKRRMLFRRLVLRNSEVVVPSLALKRIAESCWRISPARLHYIPNGIDCSRFPKRPRSPNWRGGQPVIGTVAALRPEKNILRLLHVFAEVNRHLGCRMVIVGDGPEWKCLEGLAASMGLQARVSFLGQVADPIPLYYEFDVFALTSDTEQMPYTVLEAMAAGLPVVATDVGDVKTMVARENAQLIMSPTVTELAAAMLEVCKDRESASRVGEANRTKAEREFDISSMFRCFAKLYRIAA